MARWDIDPAGVKRVVIKTADTARPFKPQAETYLARLESALESCGSKIVGQAILDFARHSQQAFPEIVGRTTRTLTGAVEATGLYLRGQDEMALQTQRNAIRPPSPVRSGRERVAGGQVFE
jgi:hypothetical protein